MENTITNPFCKDVFEAYDYADSKVRILTPEELLTEPLFFNNKFIINKNTIYFPDWSNANILKVKDIITENGKFLSLQQFQEKYNIIPRILNYYGCIGAVKAYAKKNYQNLELKSTHRHKT